MIPSWRSARPSCENHLAKLDAEIHVGTDDASNDQSSVQLQIWRAKIQTCSMNSKIQLTWMEIMEEVTDVEICSVGLHLFLGDETVEDLEGALTAGDGPMTGWRNLT